MQRKRKRRCSKIWSIDVAVSSLSVTYYTLKQQWVRTGVISRTSTGRQWHVGGVFLFQQFKRIPEWRKKDNKNNDYFYILPRKASLSFLWLPLPPPPPASRESVQQLRLRLQSSPDGHFSRSQPFPSSAMPVTHLSSPLSAASPRRSHQPWSKDSGRFTHTQLHNPPPGPLAFLRSGAVIWKSHIGVCMHARTCVLVCARGRLCACARTTPLCSSGLQEPGLGLGFGKRAAANDYFPWIIYTLNIFQSIFKSHRLVWESWGRFKEWLDGNTFPAIPGGKNLCEVKSEKFERRSKVSPWNSADISFNTSNISDSIRQGLQSLYYRSIKPFSDCRPKSDFLPIHIWKWQVLL